MDNERHALEAPRDERELRSKSAVERLVSWFRRKLTVSDTSVYGNTWRKRAGAMRKR